MHPYTCCFSWGGLGMLEIEGTYVDQTPKDQYKVHQKGADCVPKEGRAEGDGG